MGKAVHKVAGEAAVEDMVAGEEAADIAYTEKRGQTAARKAVDRGMRLAPSVSVPHRVNIAGRQEVPAALAAKSAAALLAASFVAVLEVFAVLAAALLFSAVSGAAA